MFGLIYDVLFFAIPVILIAFFFVALNRFISAKKQNKAVPGTFSDDEIKKRKITLIILSVLASIPAMIVIGFIALLSGAIALM